MKSLQESLNEASKKGRKVMTNNGVEAKAFMGIVVLDGTLKKDIEKFMNNNNALEVVEDDTQKKEFLKFQSAAENASEIIVLLYKNLTDALKDYATFKAPHDYQMNDPRRTNMISYFIDPKERSEQKSRDYIFVTRIDGGKYDF